MPSVRMESTREEPTGGDLCRETARYSNFGGQQTLIASCAEYSDDTRHSGDSGDSERDIGCRRFFYTKEGGISNYVDNAIKHHSKLKMTTKLR